MVNAPCGTNAAFARHQRRGEPIDAACRAARNAYQREHRIASSVSGQVRRLARQQALNSLLRRHAREYAELYAAAAAELCADMSAVGA